MSVYPLFMIFLDDIIASSPILLHCWRSR